MSHCFNLVFLLHTVTGDKLFEKSVAPYNGAPFTRQQPLSALPSAAADGGNPNLQVKRLMPNSVYTKDASACNMGKNAPEGGCLNNPDRECMWIHLETKDPFIAVQDVQFLCLPCEIDGQNIPCWPGGSVIGGYYHVMACKMTCPHQQALAQPEFNCVNDGGFVTEGGCFQAGIDTKSQCMFMAYELENGDKRTTCGPCFVSGVGGWGCPSMGGPGPAEGSKMIYCKSQCDVLCHGPPDCPPTVAPPPPPPPPSPGLIGTRSDKKALLGRPALPPPNPYSIAIAAAKAAKAAGWTIGTPPPPASYYPIIMYRSPKDYAFTPGPPVSSLGFPDPMAYAKGASASAMLQEDVESDDHHSPEHSPGNTTGSVQQDNIQASLISAYKKAYGGDALPGQGAPPPMPFNDMSGPPPLPPTSGSIEAMGPPPLPPTSGTIEAMGPPPLPPTSGSFGVSSMLQTGAGPVPGPMPGAGITQTTLARRKWGQ